MKKFNKLSNVERRQIFDMLKNGHSISTISLALGRPYSTISRDIKKNSFDGKYDWKHGNENAEIQTKVKNINYSKYDKFNELFLKYFDPKSSGVKVTYNKILFEFPDIEHLSISQIYNLINQGKWIINKNDLLKPIYNKEEHDKTEHKINRNVYGVYNINIRRSVINKKIRIGDYETDLINGTLGNNKGHLFVMIERKTKKIWIRFMDKRNPWLVIEIIYQIVTENNLPFYSITCDNGLEFKTLSKLRKYFPELETYYCNPYASRERGMIENVNGIIRRYFPKGTDFTKVSNDELRLVEDKINNMPREAFEWKSANDIFEEELKKLK